MKLHTFTPFALFRRLLFYVLGASFLPIQAGEAAAKEE